MALSTLEEIADFLDRYRILMQNQKQEQIDHFVSDFERLRLGMAELLSRAEVERRQTASTFNIFRLMGVAYNEVGTHSALLADLLNPKGSHAQGTLFLERFLLFCTGVFPGLPVPPLPLSPEEWTVRAELVTPQGNLDLVLTASRLGYLYVIENKLLATEQTEQLARYSRWLQQRRAGYPYQALFYLTPDGRRSSTSNGATYYRLSYRHHIVSWLEETIPAVEAPRLAETLKQYVDIVKVL
jgi:hypothetical protein